MTHHPIPPNMQQIGTLLRSGSDYGYLVRDVSGTVRFHVAFTDRELDPLPAPVESLTPLEQHADEGAAGNDRGAWPYTVLSESVLAHAYMGGWHEFVREQAADLPNDAEEQYDAAWRALIATPTTPVEV